MPNVRHRGQLINSDKPNKRQPETETYRKSSVDIYKIMYRSKYLEGDTTRHIFATQNVNIIIIQIYDYINNFVYYSYIKEDI